MFCPEKYGPVVQALWRAGRTQPLGPGRANKEVADQLQRLTPAQLVAPRTLRDERMARLCHAALWLYHDFLEECHRISQSIATIDGSYWHGLMHRREPDYANAKYWFRRVGEHPVFSTLCEEARKMSQGTNHPAADFLKHRSKWDAFAFIDLCNQAVRDSNLEPLCRAIQQREWELLFDFCFNQAAE
ncbi:MAG: hypothetical protein KatS3mg105_2149 [Gemmatales bacterium]|nr:MAG: hypothetical protein KatS3mg105_2149 [Gemmatales bacterium]